MSSYSEKSLINCVHSDPGGCMCIICFLVSKCDTFSLIANTNDPENIFQKLNEIHRRILCHWNCHLLPHRLAHICCQIPSLSPSLSYDQQCYMYQWFTGKLNCFMDTYPVLLVKALRLLIQLRNFRWVTDLCPTLITFSVTQMGVRKSRKHILDNRAPIQIWIWW